MGKYLRIDVEEGEVYGWIPKMEEAIICEDDKTGELFQLYPVLYDERQNIIGVVQDQLDPVTETRIGDTEIVHFREDQENECWREVVWEWSDAAKEQK